MNEFLYIVVTLGTSKSYGDLELHQRSSKSLLANVLDLDDNALASHNNLLNNVYSTPGPHHHTMGHGHSHIHTTPHHHHSHATPTPHHQHSTPLAHSSYPGHQLGHTPHHHQHPPDTAAPQVETIFQNACFCARYELILILKEIKVIDKIDCDNTLNVISNDPSFFQKTRRRRIGQQVYALYEDPFKYTKTLTHKVVSYLK